MRIKLPVAAPISYNPAHYLEKAFRALGHEAIVIDQSELYDLAVEDVDYLCAVDSGGPLNIPEQFLPITSMWYIDSRRNSNPDIRNPDDDATALRIINGGGLVFQAQLDDATRLFNKLIGPERRPGCTWIPLAADPDVWSDQPEKFIPDYVFSFVGNCYDPIRLQILEQLSAGGVVHWPGQEGAIMEEGAKVYRKSLAGLNIPSWLGTPECYDINMRVFEILSCGVPLITNNLPELELEEVGLHPDCYIGYDVPQELEGKELVAHVTEQIVRIATELIQNPQRAQEMGRRAREIAIKWNTYTHRAKQMLYCFESRNGNESRQR